MKKEIYLWIVLIVVIVAGALYIRYFYQPTLDITLSASSTTPKTLYPYQKVMINFGVFNNGSSTINNMSIGIVVNNNLTTLYKVTLPAGKQTSIMYNYSPILAGNYTINAVADPGKLYNLENRANAQANISVSVQAAQADTPGETLQKAGVTSIQGENLTRGGYLLSSFLANQYSLSRFALTNDASLNNFLEPVLNLTSYYIKNLSVSDAEYANGSSEYSIWIKGYLGKNIFSVAAAGSSLKWNSTNTKVGNTTFVELQGNTTFCSWYAGGWLKTLSYSGKGTCLDLLNYTTSNATILNGGINGTLYGRIAASNTIPLGNYSGVSGEKAYAAKTFFFDNISFIYAEISNNTAQNSTCYGQISFINGTYYCSSYMFPVSGKIGSLSLIRTTAYVGSYNFTTMSLVNTSIATSQIPVALDTIDSFKTPGNSLLLESGVVNTCSFNDTFGCSNITYLNGTVSFRVTNKLATPVTLNSADCSIIGTIFPTPILNVTLGSMQSASVSAQCYSVTGRLSGFLLGQGLKLAMNYTAANGMTQNALGNAFIVFG